MSKTQEETRVDGERVTLKVASASEVGKVAGAIVKFMAEGRKVVLVAIGAGAVNQAIKAVTVARGMAAPQGKNLYFIPGFCQEKFKDEGMKTAIELHVHDMRL
jgi:stage V sporulation protein S